MDQAELSATRRDRAGDVAVGLVDLALVVGPEAAVASARAVMSDDDVSAALPLLQPLALPAPVRRRLKTHKFVLAQLRQEVQDRTGAPDIELAKIERFSGRTVVTIVAVALAFYALLPQIANVDDTVDAFGDARLEWVPEMLLATIAIYLFSTISFLGSVTHPLPYIAAGRATIATAFASLVGPAASGRIAMTVRFLQRAGVETSDAGASVALNTIAGLATHLLLMFSFFAWTGSADVGGFSMPDASTFLIVFAVVVAVMIIAALLGPVRSRIVVPAINSLRRSATYAATVVQSPGRVFVLLAGSSMITLSYVAALVFSVEAYGGGLSVPQIGAAYLGAAAVANLAPTPGGLGALEAATIAALTGFGLDSGVAVSSVLTFRLATFWLPILPGWLALAWMQRNDEI